MMPAATEEDKRRFWVELNSLLPEVVPEGATAAEEDNAITLAIMGYDEEVRAIYER